MNERWLRVQVEIVRGRGEILRRRPGRVFLVGPEHTFDDLSEAIESGFGRWDRSPRYEFRLRDERITEPRELKVVERLERVEGAGEQFIYLFDPIAGWEHLCQVIESGDGWTERFPRQSVEPYPIPVDGWGALPDQYGRDDSPEFHGMVVTAMERRLRPVEHLSEALLPSSVRTAPVIEIDEARRRRDETA